MIDEDLVRAQGEQDAAIALAEEERQQITGCGVHDDETAAAAIGVLTWAVAWFAGRGVVV